MVLSTSKYVKFYKDSLIQFSNTKCNLEIHYYLFKKNKLEKIYITYKFIISKTCHSTYPEGKL